MCSVHHPFHRFDRFTALCARVKAGLLALYPRVAVAAQDKVAHHLQHFWDSQLPYGVDMSGLMRLLEAAKHIAMREVSDLLTAELRGDTFQQLLWDDSLFTESEAFVARRDELHAHWARLKKQKKILEDCRKVESNATLRAALLEAHSRESSASRAQKDWIRFWREVEESAVRVHDICCTSDFDHEGVGAFMSPHACRANNTDSGSSGSSSGSSSGAMDGAGDADTGLHSRLVSGTPGSASRPSAPGTGGVGGGACAGAGSSRKEYNNNTILSKAAAERERAERGVEGGGHLGTEGEAPWKRLREEQPVAQSYTNYLAPSAYNASAPASAPAPAPTRVKENWDDDSGEDKPAHVEVGAGVGAGAGTGVGVGTGTGVGVGSPSWLQGFSLTHSYLKNALSPSAPVTAHMPTSASKPKPAHGSGGGSAYVAGGGTPPHAFGSARQDANALADLNHLSATSASAYVYTTWEGGVATANATAATSSSKRPRSAVPTSTSAPTTASAPTSGSSGDNAYMGSRGKAAMPLRTSGADTGAEADLDTYVDPKEEAEREERAETERGWSQGNEYQYPSYLQSIVASSKRPNPDSSSKGRGRRSPEGHLQGAGMGAGAGGGSSRKHHTAQANSLNHSHRSHSRESKGEVEAIDLMDSD
ncbi:hypothetical protein B484DRAFT_108703 [Ochromonadaceae sp. CCMP2298]|nr:hypothetical protein B484DRAFT_108703 [Ochromonadaceae sp. CCMP2298]